MKISEYIAKLESIKAEHGDLEVETNMGMSRWPVWVPVVAHKLILGKRERTPRFWMEWDGEERKGEKVVRV